jgi:prepilin-type N-terminal cleavage/methylation domain-containing protein
MKGPNRERAGFTLVEVVLTLLIISGILLSLTQLLMATRRSRDTIHNIKEHQLAGPAVLDLIESDLRGLITYNRTKLHHISITDDVMSGMDGDRLDFLTSTDNLAAVYEDNLPVLYDVNEVGYLLRPNPQYDEFLEIYRREDPGVDEEPFAEGTFQFLHDRVRGFEIQVYAEDGPDAEPLDQWGVEESENIGLPAWIEIELTLELAPRLARETVLFNSRERSTVTYTRVIRLPESLRLDEANIPMPMIPSATGGGDGGGDDPQSDSEEGPEGFIDNAGRGGGAGGGRGEGGDPFGGGGRGGSSGGNPFDNKD